MSSISVPEDLYRKASEIAQAEQMSVDEVFVSAFEQHLAAWKRLQERAARGNRDAFLAVLDKVPDIEPDDSDRI